MTAKRDVGQITSRPTQSTYWPGKKHEAKEGEPRPEEGAEGEKSVRKTGSMVPV